MINRGLSLVLAAIVTAAVLWLFLTPGTLAELHGALAGASWPALGAALLVGAAVQWLRAWRFAVMTSGRLALPDAALVRIAFQLNMWNFLLPFRLGELSYPVLMRRRFGHPLLQSTGVLVLARLFDLCTVGAILLATAAWLGLPGSGASVALVVTGAVGLAFAPAALMLAGDAALTRLALVPRVGAAAGPLGAGLQALASRPAKFAAVALSFAVWVLFGALAIVTCRAVADAFPPAVAMFGAAAGNLASALPVNGIAGLGPSQAAWAAAVHAAGLDWQQAVVTALAVYGVTFTGAVLFGLIAAMGDPSPAIVRGGPATPSARPLTGRFPHE